MPTTTMVTKWKIRQVERNLRSVTTTDCEEYNLLRQLLQDTQNSLRAYLDLLQKNDSTWRCLSRRTKKLTRTFVRNFPGDHADHRVVAKATVQAIAAAPPSGTIPDRERADAERAATNAAPVVTKLVHDYLSELDLFCVSKFHLIERTYRRVALHREIHKLYTDNNVPEEKIRNNLHRLEVFTTAYNLALNENVPPLAAMMEKRYVAFKAVRVAYWSAQLRSFDSVRESLCCMGPACDSTIQKLDEAGAEIRTYVSGYVERLAGLCIKSMTPSQVECYIPTSELDDACEHSFTEKVGLVNDTRFTTPSKTSGGIFSMFSPKMVSARRVDISTRPDDMAPRNLSMPPSRGSPISVVEPSELLSTRASLPLEDLKLGFANDTAPTTPMSPVSSLDGHTTTPIRGTTDEEEMQKAAKRIMSTPRRKAVNVPWIRRKFETTAAEV